MASVEHVARATDQKAADLIARRFHEAYEALAPEFGYETRRESAVPWADVPEANKSLMVAVVSRLMFDDVISRGEGGY